MMHCSLKFALFAATIVPFLATTSVAEPSKDRAEIAAGLLSDACQETKYSVIFPNLASGDFDAALDAASRLEQKAARLEGPDAWARVWLGFLSKDIAKAKALNRDEQRVLQRAIAQYVDSFNLNNRGDKVGAISLQLNARSDVSAVLGKGYCLHEILCDLSNQLNSVDDTELQETFSQEAFELRSACLGKTNSYTGDSQIVLGYLRMQNGRADGEQMLIAGMNAVREAYGVSRYEYQRTLIWCAAMHSLKGRWQEAYLLNREALQNARRVSAPDDVIARGLVHMADAKSRLGDMTGITEELDEAARYLGGEECISGSLGLNYFECRVRVAQAQGHERLASVYQARADDIKTSMSKARRTIRERFELKKQN